MQTSTSFYASLEQTFVLPLNEAYECYENVLRMAVEQLTTFKGMKMAGLFAKVNFLVREYEMSDELRSRINDTRVRLRQIDTLDEAMLERLRGVDCRNIADFIEASYGEPMPESLRRLLPVAVEREKRTKTEASYVRMMVEHCDEETVTGVVNDFEVEQMSVRLVSKMGDASYLARFVRRHSQLNIVNPRKEEDGIYTAEYIIYEPDLLINISAVASCFENYAESPLIYLASRIAPMEPLKSAMMLGNFAGQLLDEEVHNGNETRDYRESVMDFFSHNSIGMATCPDMDSRAFHQECRQQRTNIHEAMGHTLPQLIGAYDKRQVMLEPSFFCEMLGLQGRMDLLQLDYRVLIEQKAGKGANQWPMQNPSAPVAVEKHYVQLLLYMALLHYNFSMSNKDISAFLLYSKYPESLLHLGPAPELLHRAIKIRNQIASLEVSQSRDGFDFLRSLSSDSFRQKPINDNYWRCIAPKYDSLLRPLGQASPLERKYYLRFLRFLATENLLARIGADSKEGSGSAARWHDTLEEKRNAGNIYDSLRLTSPQEGDEGEVDRVTLAFTARESLDMGNFRLGDSVMLYPYNEGEEPDGRRTMVHRAVISEIKADSIALSLRSPQTDAHVLCRDAGRPWAIEHDFLDSASNGLMRSMHSLLTASQSRRDLIMTLRRPEVDEQLTLRGDYGSFNDLSLRVRQARELFLIIGPPGTGKTSYGMLNTLLEELKDEDASVLLTSYTNRAVDEICGKLVEQDIDFVRIGNSAACADTYRNHMLEERVRGCANVEQVKTLIRQARVVVGTTSSVTGSSQLFALRGFTLAIIDEASQILEPHLIGILCAKHAGEDAIRRFVFIGDHKQLPAVVQQSLDDSRVTDEDLLSIGLTDCRLSLFERLLKKYRYDPTVTYMLTHQGRMHREIAEFPNYEFYQNNLHVVPLEHQDVSLPESSDAENGIDQLLQTRRIVFLAVDAPEKHVSDKVNLDESAMIAATVYRAYRMKKEEFDVNQTIGVIVPYRNQIAAVRRDIDAYGVAELHDITIDTVERYQGSQRDVIIYGFTVQKAYQLSFLAGNTFEEEGALIDRKLNVAMTRARKHLVMVGNPTILAENTTFFRLMEYVRLREGYFRITPKDYCDGRFTVTPRHYADSEEFDQLLTRQTLLGYGRTDMINSMTLYDAGGMRTEYSPEALASLYDDSVASSLAEECRSVLDSNREALMDGTESVSVVDLMSGAATFCRTFYDFFDGMDINYTAVDRSPFLQDMCRERMEAMGIKGRVCTSFDELTEESFSGSFCIVNCGLFFGRTEAREAERVARMLRRMVEEKVMKRLVVVVEQPKCDFYLQSYTVFHEIIGRFFSASSKVEIMKNENKADVI